MPEPKPGSLAQRMRERAERAEAERDEALALVDTAMLVRDTAIADAEIRGAAWMRESVHHADSLSEALDLDPEQVCAERREREGA